MRSIIMAALWSIALMTFSAPLGALAHEGEDHGNAEVARQQVAAAPRTEAASDLFELVAVARGGELTIFLDRFASNEPIPNAAITVETPAGSVEAVAAADETHRLAAPWSRTPGRYDLILTVVSDGAADVLSLTLQVPDRSSTPAPAASSLKPINGGFDRRSGPLRFRRTSRGRVGRSPCGRSRQWPVRRRLAGEGLRTILSHESCNRPPA
jgi:hypothetical protein